MMDYHGFFWSILVYFGLVPSLIGAGIMGVRAWPAQPFQGIVTVRPLGHVFAEPAPGCVTTPAVLDNRDVTMADEVPGLQGPRLDGLVVRSAEEKHGKGAIQGLPCLGRPVQVRGQDHPIPHGHHNVSLDVGLIGLG